MWCVYEVNGYVMSSCGALLIFTFGMIWLRLYIENTCTMFQEILRVCLLLWLLLARLYTWPYYCAVMNSDACFVLCSVSLNVLIFCLLQYFSFWGMFWFQQMMGFVVVMVSFNTVQYNEKSCVHPVLRESVTRALVYALYALLISLALLQWYSLCSQRHTAWCITVLFSCNPACCCCRYDVTMNSHIDFNFNTQYCLLPFGSAHFIVKSVHYAYARCMNMHNYDRPFNIGLQRVN